MIKKNTHRFGITFVETLVVIGIVASLFALLIPAIQRIRESAANTSCRNQLRQLGLAAHDYAAIHGVLPPGYLGNFPANAGRDASFWQAQWVGSLAFLLPHVGRSDLHLRLNVNWSTEAVGKNWLDSPECLEVAAQTVNTFHCPWDDPYRNQFATIACMGFYQADGQVVIVSRLANLAQHNSLGRTNYVGVAGKYGKTQDATRDQFEGVFFNRSRVSLASVSLQDGTSNVLMFGESLPDAGGLTRDYAFAWMGVGCIPSFQGIYDVAPGSLGFSSMHPSVVNFVLCDASVRSIRKNSNLQQFINLSAYHDGNPSGSELLGD